MWVHTNVYLSIYTHVYLSRYKRMHMCVCVHTYVNKFYILILSSEFIPIHLEILKLKQFQFTYLQIDFRAKDLSASL